MTKEWFESGRTISRAGRAIGWDDCSRADWDGYLAACGQSSLEQSWAYGSAIAAGRRAQAHNVLLWRAIEGLKDTGADWLDLGGVDARRAPGIARFKLGLGARLFTLSGTYI